MGSARGRPAGRRCRSERRRRARFYGGGSPTGNAFYENGALGAAWEGTFLAAEAGRNEVFSYQPKPSAAGFALERKIFLTSNKEQKYAGSDFLGGNTPGRISSAGAAA
jgi:hypothetical protein